MITELNSRREVASNEKLGERILLKDLLGLPEFSVQVSNQADFVRQIFVFKFNSLISYVCLREFLIIFNSN